MKKYFLLTMLMAFALGMRANNPQQEGNRDGDYYFDVNIHTYPNTMTYMAIIELDGVEQMREDIEIGFFVGDECRGREKPTSMYAAALGHYYVMFSLYGNDGDNISTFRLYDHALQQELSVSCSHDPIIFVTNGMVGDPLNPEVFSFTSVASYLITATANPTEGGIVTGGGYYEENAECTLTATANEGYTFVNWTKDGEVITTETTYTFTVTEAAAYVANFQINSYEITATANPDNAGTIAGAGTYDHFETCTLTATASEGYHFVNWTKDGEVVSTEANYSFTVTGPAAYVANFELNSYEITVSANPEEGGTVAGGGTFNHFETCTLTATANEGYHFVNWTKGGEVVSTEATYTFTVTEAAAYVANFELNSYEITVSANPEAGGTVAGGGTYNHFETCTLTATANEGYYFVNWTKGGEVVSTEATYTFTVTEAAAYVANFELYSYEITATANPENAGTIAGTGTYNHFETCTLTATANEGYHFMNWTMDGEVVSTEATYSFTVTGPAAFVANFELNSYEIMAVANPEEGGAVSGAGTFNHFETCTLTATANEGYHFVNWTKGGEEVSTEATYTFTVTETATYVANFELNSYEITATVNPEGSGVIIGAGVYDHGTTCTLSVVANPGYSFLNWTKNGEEVSTTESFSFVVTEPAAYVANFEIVGYEIVVTSNPEEGGTTTGGGVYVYGATATLTATANEGYHFVNWTMDGEEVTTETTYSFVVTESAAYVANFQINSYEITATANPTAGGTISGAGTYNHFASCTLIATVNEGYTFINWTKNGEEVSTELSFSFVVTEPAAYVANFQINSYTINATANPTVAGTITGAGVYDYGTAITLVATANEGYTFINWTKDGNVVSNSMSYNITVTEDADYVANFELNSYEITVSANPEAGGIVAGAGTYNHFETCTLTATPAENYIFVNWSKDGVVLSTDAVYSFMVVEGGDYVATFAPNEFQITVSANPTNGGTVTGGGVYNYGTTATLTATARTGFTFVNWTKDGNVVSTDDTYSFTVTEAGYYVANFSRNDCVITAIADPADGGNITGAGTYGYGTACILTATPAPGYTFVNWTKDGQFVSSSATYHFAVTEDATYVAHFLHNQYYVTVTANPSNSGSVTGAGAYMYGETCTVTAFANTGYHFVRWTKNGTQVSTNIEYSFTVTENADVVGYFELNEYQITAVADPANAGTITGTGTYIHGSTATLTADANTGSAFVNWTKNGHIVSTNATYSFTVTESAEYVAHFTSSTHVVTTGAHPAIGGQVSGAGTYAHGASCTVVATPNEGYVFVKWMQGGVQVSTQPSYSFTVTENTHCTAYFVLQNCTITAEATPVEGGEVSGAGVFEYGETCTLEATPNENYLFVEWQKEGVQVSTDATYSFTVTEDAHYTAVFYYVDGVGEYNGMRVTLYPNPAKDKLMVETSEPINLFEIYSISGALVYRQKDCSDKIEVNVSNFSIGAYMIRLTTDSTVETRRFVKE